MPAAWCASLLEEARAGVAQAIASLDAPGVSVRGLAVPGPAARTLLARAAAEDADVLVVGVHPHVLGSTTHPVVRGAACPVVTIPPTSAGRDNS
jgi:nucleotide-binding universal stress UspA family protein